MDMEVKGSQISGCQDGGAAAKCVAGVHIGSTNGEHTGHDRRQAQAKDGLSEDTDGECGEREIQRGKRKPAHAEDVIPGPFEQFDRAEAHRGFIAGQHPGNSAQLPNAGQQGEEQQCEDDQDFSALPAQPQNTAQLQPTKQQTEQRKPPRAERQRGESHQNSIAGSQPGDEAEQWRLEQEQRPVVAGLQPGRRAPQHICDEGRETFLGQCVEAEQEGRGTIERQQGGQRRRKRGIQPEQGHPGVDQETALKQQDRARPTRGIGLKGSGLRAHRPARSPEELDDGPVSAAPTPALRSPDAGSRSCLRRSR